MTEQLEFFLDSINLTATDPRTFRDKFNKGRPTANGGPTQVFMLENACLAAELFLGPSKVDRASLNKTNVEQN